MEGTMRWFQHAKSMVHLVERGPAQHVDETASVNQDLVDITVFDPHNYHHCIIIRLVDPASLFLREGDGMSAFYG